MPTLLPSRLPPPLCSIGMDAAPPKPKRPRLLPAVVGEARPEAEGDVSDLLAGSMSSVVRKDESDSPLAVDVLARKISSSWFCSARRTPCNKAENQLVSPSSP